MSTFSADPAFARPPARAVDSTTNAGQRMDTGSLAVSLSRVIRSEWVKFRSLRSNWLAMLSAVAVVVGVGALSAAVLSGAVGPGDDGWADETSPTAISLGGTLLAQVVVGIVGVLAITSEFATGMIRATFAAVPTRLPVLWAKAAVLAGVTFAAMLPTMLASFLIGQALFGSDQGASLSDAGALRAVVGSAGYLTAVALIGLGLGSILRQAAGAIGVVVGLLLVAPGILDLALPSSADGLVAYLPAEAGQAMSWVGPDQGLLSPAVGAVVLVGWVAAFLGVAAVLLGRRDA